MRLLARIAVLVVALFLAGAASASAHESDCPHDGGAAASGAHEPALAEPDCAHDAELGVHCCHASAQCGAVGADLRETDAAALSLTPAPLRWRPDRRADASLVHHEVLTPPPRQPRA